MGLGAFTKVVGDAGVTVAKRAPLPITTGNSYSAIGCAVGRARRHAAHAPAAQAQGKERVKFKAMVVGATGAIGSACARLLVRAAEEVYLVSPETAKLLALKESIEAESPAPRCTWRPAPSTRHRRHGHDRHRHLGRGQEGAGHHEGQARLRDHRRGAPAGPAVRGVAKRPDVLVVERRDPAARRRADEEHRPAPGVAYACLAETIVLALEGRFENFTVGRAIEWEKVREIYQLGLKHGMKLAAISGVNGVFSDDDIARVRELALKARAAAAGAPAKKPAARRLPATKAAAKKAPAKKAPAPKTAVKKAAAKKAAART
jgi:hypothetical protein